MSTELDTQVTSFLLEVTSAMGLDLTTTSEEVDQNVRINLSGEGADVLLQRKGEALDALQVIVNTVFRRDARGDRYYIVDALDYRRGKDAELRQMTQFLIDKVKTSGAPQEIGPLNPYSRRLVHLAVAEDPAVTSESVGDAFLKSVVISPS